MMNFSKSVACPSSDQLLRFQNDGLGEKLIAEIARHLAECEFCSAEVDIYSRYPQAEDPPELAEIPMPLFELAESLLKNKHTDKAWLDKLWPRTENLAVEKN